MSLGVADPSSFAREWIDAWNRRDVEAVLTMYAEDVFFTSPTARRVVPDSGGVITGKRALREYWGRALAVNHDLHFELVAVYAGVRTIIINYQNQVGGLVCEMVRLGGDGLIAEGHATHLT
jgi:ketosteroid isomerase-like protein